MRSICFFVARKTEIPPLRLPQSGIPPRCFPSYHQAINFLYTFASKLSLSPSAPLKPPRASGPRRYP
jgi:hypothetical protein